MKNRALLILLFTVVVSNLFATHYRGGEITYRILGNYTVEATVTTYTKISFPANLADRDSIVISWGDGTTSIIPRINGTNDGSCNGASPCGVAIATDIKQNIYAGTHTYAGPPPGSSFYALSFTDDNLSGDIANIDNGNSIGVPFFVSNEIYIGSSYNAQDSIFDASPVFLNPPKYYATQNQKFTFNSAAYDPDGDSLSYALVTPHADLSDVVPIYIFPGNYCASIDSSTNNVFQIDAHTGEITWVTPCAQGFFQIVIEVREFRCGLFIGIVDRNMQISVLSDANTTPVLSAVHDTILQAGQSMQVNISSIDSGLSAIDSIRVLGEPFLNSLSLNRPTFQSSTGNPATGVFTWQPDASFGRRTAYMFTVISTNNFKAIGPDGNMDPYPASDAETFRVWVAATTDQCPLTAIDNLSATDLKVSIFPNPANSVLHIQTSGQVSSLTVSDLLGNEVLSIEPNSLDYDLTVNGLENGVYLLSIVMNGTRVTRKFIKLE